MGLEDFPYLAEDAFEHLGLYHWPGNVRELENAVERAIILSRDRSLTFDDLTKNPGKNHLNVRNPEAESTHTLDAAMRNQIQIALEKTEGVISGDRGAAKLLGIHPSTLRARMRKMGIPFGRKFKKYIDES
jgi:DNA-binding NtrC family response regulator